MNNLLLVMIFTSHLHEPSSTSSILHIRGNNNVIAISTLSGHISVIDRNSNNKVFCFATNHHIQDLALRQKTVTLAHYNSATQTHYVTSINCEQNYQQTTFSSKSPFIYSSTSVLQKKIVSCAVTINGDYNIWNDSEILHSGNVRIGKSISSIHVCENYIAIARGNNVVDIFDFIQQKRCFSVVVPSMTQNIGQIDIQLRFRRLILKFLSDNTNCLYETTVIPPSSNVNNCEVVNATRPKLISKLPGVFNTNKLQHLQNGKVMVLCSEKDLVGLVTRSGLKWIKCPRLSSADISNEHLFWSTSHKIFLKNLKHL